MTAACPSTSIALMNKDEKSSNTRYGRFKAIGAGLILIVVGKLRLMGDIEGVTHWTGQPMFSWGLIAAGLLRIVSALVPQSWIARAVGAPRGRHTR
jgi:hypothetical protein